MHSFGLTARYPGTTLKLALDVVCQSHRSIIVRFPLALTVQPVALSTGKYRAAEENRHAPPASSTKISPQPAKMAGLPFRSDGVFHRLPLSDIISASVAVVL